MFAYLGQCVWGALVAVGTVRRSHFAYLGNCVKGALAGEVLLKDGSQQVVLLCAGRLLGETVRSSDPHLICHHLRQNASGYGLC